jgi:hypothetical protein
MTALDLLPDGLDVGLSPVDAELGAEVLAHLASQLQSAQALLSIVLRQGAAIRAREVHEVVAAAGLMQAELERRAILERERAALLSRAAVRLSVDPGAVTLERLCAVIGPTLGNVARERSAQLRGMLTEIRREHHTNRALMAQQLSFLDHLLGLADLGRRSGYDAAGGHAPAHDARIATGHRVLDLEI